MATKYERGRRFEDYIIQKLREKGYYPCRSSASRGVFDILAVKNGIPFGIQCKAGTAKLTKKEREKILEAGRKYGIRPFLATKRGRRVVFIYLPTGKGVEL